MQALAVFPVCNLRILKNLFWKNNYATDEKIHFKLFIQTKKYTELPIIGYSLVCIKEYKKYFLLEWIGGNKYTIFT